MLQQYGTEFNILLDISLRQMQQDGFKDIGQYIDKVRKGEVEKIPGYDGEYGIINIKKQTSSNVQNLFTT